MYIVQLCLLQLCNSRQRLFGKYHNFMSDRRWLSSWL